MPMLDVVVVGAVPEPGGLAQRLADAVGEALREAPGRTWVRLRECSGEEYAEHGGAPEGVSPVFVWLLRAVPLDGEARRDELRAVATAVAGVTGRPAARVHVVLEPDGAGRVAFGGVSVPRPERRRAATGVKWEALVGYSRAVRVRGTVWVTGTTATLPDGGHVGDGDAEAQARQCLANITRALAMVDATPTDVVRTRMFVTDITRDWEAVGRAHAEVFGDVRPATTMVEVRALIEPWMLVEIEADAVVD